MRACGQLQSGPEHEFVRGLRERVVNDTDANNSVQEMFLL